MIGVASPYHLPKGVSETPRGDLGKHRQQEARELGTFKQVEDISTEFGSSVKPNQAMDESYHPHKGKEVR